MQDTLLILHLLGMSMGVGTGFVMLVLSANAAKLPPDERMQYMGRISASSAVSSIGLLLLIVTGIIMAIQEWSMIGMITTFHIKLGLVLLLVIAFGIAQMSIAKLKRGEAGPADAKRMAVLGPIMTLLGVLIVVFAVISFHQNLKGAGPGSPPGLWMQNARRGLLQRAFVVRILDVARQSPIFTR